jgi:HSP20 family protein
MRELGLYNNDCPFYPGAFIPLPDEERMLQELLNSGKKTAEKLLVNMDEYNDCYKIEAALPGIRREDVFVYVKGNILSVIVLHKDCEDAKKKSQIHEFDCRCIERHIALPENADAEFVSAEFRQGILRLHIPKADKYPAVHTQQIVVY